MPNNKPDTQAIKQLSALEQIKALELEIARQVALVQYEDSQAEANTQHEASEIHRMIKSEGHSQAEARYQEIVATAMTQAQTITEQVHQESQRLKHQQAHLIEQATFYALKLILGIGDEEGET